MLDALIIAAHPDDAELGMGGTILRMLEDGLCVGILDLTNGEPTPLGTPEIRMSETQKATEVLGITWRENLGLPNRKLQPDLAARTALAGVIRQTRPRWLLPHANLQRRRDSGQNCRNATYKPNRITRNGSFTSGVFTKKLPLNHLL